MFVGVALNPEYKTFIVHIAALSVDSNNRMHPLKRAQMAHLKADKAFSKVSSKYTNFANIFLLKLAVELPKHIRINNHTIKLVND